MRESINKRLQTVLYKHEKALEEWYERILDYQQQYIIPYNLYWDVLREVPQDMEDVLRKLLEILIGYGGKGHTWKWHESLEYGTGFRTGIISAKIDHAYFLGIDKESIYFEAPLACPESIHKMFDRFVHAIADYSRFGMFYYQQNEIFDDDILRVHRGLLKQKIKGQLPDLLRDYFIAKAELDAEFDFGFLEIRWPLNRFTMHQVLTEACMAFEIIHHLNVDLWKKSKSREGKTM